jgi:serine/threonine-protein phosphatase 2A regulatory subunit B'
MRNTGGKLPEGFVEIDHAPPPPPPVIDDSDIMDLSMELNAVSIDDITADLDEKGIERVPMADPVAEVRMRLTNNIRCRVLIVICLASVP